METFRSSDVSGFRKNFCRNAASKMAQESTRLSRVRGLALRMEKKRGSYGRKNLLI